ncbi:MAG: UbiA family prenyltransferase [Asgard group archaeon]|nr:UbiA family prenyltransferase [Asgard group archaeon]
MITDHLVIKEIILSHCAKGPERCDICKKLVSEKKICLLKISSESKGRTMRVMEYTIDDKKGLYEFEVEKIFNEEADAIKYSKENNVPLELESKESIISEDDVAEKPKTKEKKSKMQIIMVDWRVGRFIMFFMITAAVTYGLEGTWQEVLYAGAIGVLVAFTGFFLDYISDMVDDKKSGKLSNPIAKGTLNPIFAVVLIVTTLFASIILTIFTNEYVLIPIGILVLVIIFQGVFDFMNTPIVRAITLGVLQGLYVIIGALCAHNLNVAAGLMTLFLFFAMTGGRAAGDTRDLPHDLKVETMTLPKKYGPRGGAIFMLVNQFLAYGVGIGTYFTGVFKIGFLICMIITVVIGSIMSIIFVIKPTPKVANIVNMLSFGILGMLFIIGLITGRLTPIV